MAGAGSRRSGSGRGAGGGVGKSAEAKLLHRLEDEIRHGKKETGIVIMPDGRVVRVEGKRHSVSFSTPFMATARGATLTHNHPTLADGRSKVARLAQQARSGRLTLGFSDADIRLAERWGLREMRAVGETRNYSFRPKAGTGSAALLYRTVDRRNTALGRTMIQQQNQKWARRYQAAERAGDTMRAARIAELSGRVQRGLSAGFNYIVTSQTMRDLRRAGFDVSSRRGRPLVTVKRR